MLLTLEPTPVARVNHAVALAETGQLASAPGVLDTLKPVLADFQPFHAAQAALLAQAGHTAAARQAYATATALANNESNRLFPAAQARRLV